MKKLYGIVLLSVFTLMDASDNQGGKLPDDFKFGKASSENGERTSFMSQWNKFSNKTADSYNNEDCFHLTGEESDDKKLYCRSILLAYFSQAIDGPLVKSSKSSIATFVLNSSTDITITPNVPLKVTKVKNGYNVDVFPVHSKK